MLLRKDGATIACLLALGAGGTAVLVATGARGERGEVDVRTATPTLAAAASPGAASPSIGPTLAASVTPERTTIRALPAGPEDLALPDLRTADGVVVAVTASFRAQASGAVMLATGDEAVFPFAGALVTRAPSGEFIVEARYGPAAGKSVTVMSWTPVHPVSVSLPVGPTHEGREFQVAGRQVVVIVPTTNVVGRRGLYRAYIAGERAVHLVDANDFGEGDDFPGLVQRMAESGELR